MKAGLQVTFTFTGGAAISDHDTGFTYSLHFDQEMSLCTVGLGKSQLVTSSRWLAGNEFTQGDSCLVTVTLQEIQHGIAHQTVISKYHSERFLEEF